MAQVNSRLGRVRSLLTIDPTAVDKAEGPRSASADALIIDIGSQSGLHRTVRAAKIAAVAAFVTRARNRAYRPLLFVRVSPLDEAANEGELDAVMPSQPDGIILVGSLDGAAVQQLGVKLAVREATHGLPDGTTAIVAEAGGTAAGLMALRSLQGVSPRLAALTWDSGALAADVGGAPGLFGEDDGAQTVARTLMVLGARAAGIPAFDTACALPGEALARECAAARRFGFAGKVTRDPDQVAIINTVFGRDAVRARA